MREVAEESSTYFRKYQLFPFPKIISVHLLWASVFFNICNIYFSLLCSRVGNWTIQMENNDYLFHMFKNFMWFYLFRYPCWIQKKFKWKVVTTPKWTVFTQEDFTLLSRKVLSPCSFLTFCMAFHCCWWAIIGDKGDWDSSSLWTTYMCPQLFNGCDFLLCQRSQHERQRIFTST